MLLAKIDQFISNEAFLLNEEIWLLYLSLKVLDARPIYSALSSEFSGPVFDIISALYIIDFDKHSPRRGQECTVFTFSAITVV